MKIPCQAIDKIGKRCRKLPTKPFYYDGDNEWRQYDSPEPQSVVVYLCKKCSGELDRFDPLAYKKELLRIEKVKKMSIAYKKSLIK